jgi:hypothetical protein
VLNPCPLNGSLSVLSLRSYCQARIQHRAFHSALSQERFGELNQLISDWGLSSHHIDAVIALKDSIDVKLRGSFQCKLLYITTLLYLDFHYVIPSCIRAVLRILYLVKGGWFAYNQNSAI